MRFQQSTGMRFTHQLPKGEEGSVYQNVASTATRIHIQANRGDHLFRLLMLASQQPRLLLPESCKRDLRLKAIESRKILVSHFLHCSRMDSVVV